MEEVAGSIPARSTNLSLMSMVARRIFLGYRAEPEQQKGAWYPKYSSCAPSRRNFPAVL